MKKIVTFYVLALLLEFGAIPFIINQLDKTPTAGTTEGLIAGVIIVFLVFLGVFTMFSPILFCFAKIQYNDWQNNQ